MIIMEEWLYNPAKIQSFEKDTCFLCGKLFDEDNELDKRTDEHVFPDWLLRKYNLRKQHLTLVNETSIRFNQLKIYCCKSCNNNFLNPNLETPVSNTVSKGYEEFVKLDQQLIWQWTAKIMYGMLYRELSLQYDIRDRSKGFITTPELLKMIDYLHEFLQSIRVPFNFVDFKPWSIFVYEIYKAKDDEFCYQSITNPNGTVVLSLQMGNIGLISCHNDFEVLQMFFQGTF